MFNPLLFADWQKIHNGLTVIMWFVAFVIAMVIILHFAPATAVHAAHHPHWARYVVPR